MGAKTLNNLVLPSSYMMRTARGLGEVVARIPFEPDALLIHVSNKIKLMDVLLARESNFFGRFLNRIAREEVERIVLDGVVVKQLYELIGAAPPMEIDAGARYEVHHSDVRELYRLASEAVANTA